MAKILSFINGDREIKPPKPEVDAYFQTLDSGDGTRYVYVYNYAEGGPQPGASPTQSLHFDGAAAKAFKEILENTFGTL